MAIPIPIPIVDIEAAYSGPRPIPGGRRPDELFNASEKILPADMSTFTVSRVALAAYKADVPS
jgi:hypothetical protein